jgi:hypothetical protein
MGKEFKNFFIKKYGKSKYYRLLFLFEYRQFPSLIAKEFNVHSTTLWRWGKKCNSSKWYK